MSKQTFVWPVLQNISGRFKPEKKIVKFGSGYEQRVKRGMHSNLPSYQVKLTEAPALAGVILDFLDAHESVDSFYWTPPRKPQGLFVCETWTSKEKGTSVDIAATFRQVVA